MLSFAEWFESTNGETLTHERVTPTDLGEYKSYLLINLKRTPSTVNLSFVAIANWLDFNGQNVPMPSYVEEVRSAPQALERLDRRSLTRAVERVSIPRDIVLITLMLNTGLRISEEAALDIDDPIIEYFGVTEPLLDEPFPALDSQVKKKMEKEVLDVRNAFSGTMILVTHSLEEAFRLCSNIAVMDNGNIIQLGAQDEIIHQPANSTVARLTGTENIFDGTVIERHGETALLRIEELDCQLTIPNTLKQDKLSLGIRPARIIVDQDHCTRTEDLVNQFPGRIVQTIPAPDGQIVYIQLARDDPDSLSNNSTCHTGNVTMIFRLMSRSITENRIIVCFNLGIFVR
ncbi:hypothetical protein [Desulfosporosinus fructosivorans]